MSTSYMSHKSSTHLTNLNAHNVQDVSRSETVEELQKLKNDVLKGNYVTLVYQFMEIKKQ